MITVKEARERRNLVLAERAIRQAEELEARKQEACRAAEPLLAKKIDELRLKVSQEIEKAADGGFDRCHIIMQNPENECDAGYVLETKAYDAVMEEITHPFDPSDSFTAYKSVASDYDVGRDGTYYQWTISGW